MWLCCSNCRVRESTVLPVSLIVEAHRFFFPRKERKALEREDLNSACCSDLLLWEGVGSMEDICALTPNCFLCTTLVGTDLWLGSCMWMRLLDDWGGWRSINPVLAFAEVSECEEAEAWLHYAIFTEGGEISADSELLRSWLKWGKGGGLHVCMHVCVQCWLTRGECAVPLLSVLTTQCSVGDGSGKKGMLHIQGLVFFIAEERCAYSNTLNTNLTWSLDVNVRRWLSRHCLSLQYQNPVYFIPVSKNSSQLPCVWRVVPRSMLAGSCCVRNHLGLFSCV